MKLKVKIGDEVQEVGLDSLELPDGVHIITPNNIPKGYFTQKALDDKIAEITAKKDEKAKAELKSDTKFHREILSEYNISLDESGNPKGLKPDFDVDAWKKEQAQKLTEPLRNELDSAKSQLDKFRNGLKRAEILKHANGLFKSEYTQSFTGNDDPFVVKQFADAFDVDDNGVVALKDETGFAIDGDGKRITPDKFFNQNKDKFASLLADNRQRGANVGGGVGGGRRFTQADIAKMSDAEYAKNRDAIMEQTALGAID